MEWERAKNYIIIFFILLNAGLGLLLFMEDRRYTMTSEQERLIRTVLDRNNISMYTVPMRRFPPMRPLDVTSFYYNEAALIQILFDNPQAVESQPEIGLFYDATSSDERILLSIHEGFIFFENPSGKNHQLEIHPDGITRPQAIYLTAEFINRHFPDFVHGFPDMPLNTDDGIRIIYRQQYRNQVVHSNFIEFLVTDVGIQQIEMQFGQILGHSGTATMIFSPDEALLAFVQRVRQFTRDTPMTITHMDLVYFQHITYEYGSTCQAVPFYRIFTSGDDRPFLINAFTNEIID